MKNLTGPPGVTASYDANGNQTSSTPMATVSWNALNQPGGPGPGDHFQPR